MNSLSIVLLSLCFAFAFAVDITVTPTGYTSYDGIAQNSNVQIANSAGVTLTDVTFSVIPDNSNVQVSFPSGTSVGSISNAASGYGVFQIVGSTGWYSLNVTVRYKKSGVQYSYSHFPSLNVITEGGGGEEGKRVESAVMIDLKFAEGERSDLALRSDLTLSPGSYNAYDGIAQWYPVYITAGSSALQNVSFTVTPDSSNVQIAYPPAPQTNYIGPIAASATATASFQISGSLGYYNLNVTIKYKINGGSFKYAWAVATLQVLDPNEGSSSEGRRSDLSLSASARSALANVYTNKDGSFKVEYIVGTAVGVALFAGVAIVGAALFLRKRNQTTLLA